MLRRWASRTSNQRWKRCTTGIAPQQTASWVWRCRGIRAAPLGPAAMQACAYAVHQNRRCVLAGDIATVSLQISCVIVSEGIVVLLATQPQTAASSSNEDSLRGRLRALRAKLRTLALAAFLRLYPLLHMAGEGACFGYQLAYLLQASPYFSPTLHLLRQHVVRASGRELVSHHCCDRSLDRAIIDCMKRHHMLVLLAMVVRLEEAGTGKNTIV